MGCKPPPHGRLGEYQLRIAGRLGRVKPAKVVLTIWVEPRENASRPMRSIGMQGLF